MIGNGIKNEGKKARKSDRLTMGYLVLMSTIYLLFVGPEGYTQIGQNKVILFYAITVSYLMAFSAVKIRDWQQAGKESGVRWGTTERFLILYLCFTIVSALHSPFGIKTLLGAGRSEGVLTILLYGFIFFAVSDLRSHPKWMIYLLGGATSIFCTIAFFQLAGRNPFGLYPGELTYYHAELSYHGEYLSTIGNVDLVGAFLCLVIPLFLFYMLLSKDENRLFLVIPLVSCLILWYRMEVQAAYLGVVLGCVLASPAALSSEKQSRKIYWMALLISGAISLIAMFFFDSNISIFHEAHEILHGRIDETFGTSRIFIWKNTLEIWRDHLWLGSGPDTLVLWGRGFDSFVESHGVVAMTVIDAAHNEYLNIGVNQGLLALISYFLFLISVFAYWIKGMAQSEKAVIGAASICYLIQAFFGISTCLTTPYFWIVLAFLYSQSDNR